MRPRLWSFDNVHVDLEDRDACVTAVHGKTGTEIKVQFRLSRDQLSGPVEGLRQRLELLATDQILDLSSFLDRPG
jgi:hypothetical protein